MKEAACPRAHSILRVYCRARTSSCKASSLAHPPSVSPTANHKLPRIWNLSCTTFNKEIALLLQGSFQKVQDLNDVSRKTKRHFRLCESYPEIVILWLPNFRHFPLHQRTARAMPSPTAMTGCNNEPNFPRMAANWFCTDGKPCQIDSNDHQTNHTQKIEPTLRQTWIITKVIAFCKILRHCKENTIQIKVIIKAISLLSLFSASLPPPSHPLACFLPARPSKVWWFGTCAASETIAAISPLATLQLGRLCLGRPVPTISAVSINTSKNTPGFHIVPCNVSQPSTEYVIDIHGCEKDAGMSRAQNPLATHCKISAVSFTESLIRNKCKGRRWSRTQWKWSLSNPKRAVCRNLDERCSKEGLDWRFSAKLPPRRWLGDQNFEALTLILRKQKKQ